MEDSIDWSGSDFLYINDYEWTRFFQGISKLNVQKLKLQSCKLPTGFFSTAPASQAEATVKEINLSGNDFLWVKQDMWAHFFQAITNLNVHKLKLKSCKLSAGFFSAAPESQVEGNMEELNLSHNNFLDIKHDTWVHFFQGISNLNVQKLNLKSCKLSVEFFAVAQQPKFKATVEIEDSIDWSGSDFSGIKEEMWIRFFRGISNFKVQKLKLKSCRLPVAFLTAAAKSQIKAAVEMENPTDLLKSNFSGKDVQIAILVGMAELLKVQRLSLAFTKIGPVFVSTTASHIASGGQLPHFENIAFKSKSDFSSITGEEWKRFFDGVLANSSIKDLTLERCHLGVPFIKGFSSVTADFPEILETLNLEGNNFGDVIETEWAEFLDRLLKSNVKTFDLPRCQLNSGFIEAFSATPQNVHNRLEGLDLGGNNFENVSESEWKEFLNRLLKSNVKKFDLPRCQLNSGFIKAFSATPQNVRNKLDASSKSEKAVHLQQLNLSHNDFSALKEASFWARFLQTISELKVAKLILASCNLPIDFAAALLDKKTDLQELNLAGNYYFSGAKADDWVRFFRGITTPKVQKVNLGSSKLGPEFVSAAVSHIASGGQLPHLENIGFQSFSDFSSISEEEWKRFFGGVLANSSIKDLTLYKLHLGVPFIKGFLSATADFPETLEKLDLQWNNFGDVSEAEWAEFLNRLLKSNVKTLDLHRCQLNSGFIKAFSATPQNVHNRLEGLILWGNNFENVSESEWKEFLSRIASWEIKRLHLRDCYLPSSFVSAFSAVMRGNDTLEGLDLSIVELSKNELLQETVRTMKGL